MIEGIEFHFQEKEESEVLSKGFLPYFAEKLLKCDR